jgi:hypothetical protein
MAVSEDLRTRKSEIEFIAKQFKKTVERNIDLLTNSDFSESQLKEMITHIKVSAHESLLGSYHTTIMQPYRDIMDRCDKLISQLSSPSVAGHQKKAVLGFLAGLFEKDVPIIQEKIAELFK